MFLCAPPFIKTAAAGGGGIDLSTASLVNTYYWYDDFTELPIGGLALVNDGEKIWVDRGGSTRRIVEYTLSPAGDITTASFTANNLYRGSVVTNCNGLNLCNSGSNLIMGDGSDDYIWEYALSTPGSLTGGGSWRSKLTTGAQSTSLRGAVYNSDGTKLYVAKATGKVVEQWSCSTAFNISTATYDSVYIVISDVPLISGISISADSRYLFFSARYWGAYMYEMTTPGDLSTAVYVDSFQFPESNDVVDGAIQVTSDGSGFYFIDWESGSYKIHQYSLG